MSEPGHLPLKLPRTIRLDPSDTFVFEVAAEPGEWAVSGAFLFDGLVVPDLPVKRRAAFRSGFLGIDRLGFSTLAVVSPATPDELEAAVALLAARFSARLGAPEAAALAAAEAEFAHAASLCHHPDGTLIALQRSWEDGDIRERFRTLTPRTDTPRDAFRVFEFVESEDDTMEISERVDLVSLSQNRSQP